MISAGKAGKKMDQVKIGKFIAQLRRENGMTQEALGEKLGVTNKTISRWETGAYMPDIEMLQLLGQNFGVSINEILAGQRLSDEEFRQKAEENVIAVSKASAFSLEEKKTYYKKKWRKDHMVWLVSMAVVVVAVTIVLPLVVGKPWFIGTCPVVALIYYAYMNNKMMTYVENNIYQ